MQVDADPPVSLSGIDLLSSSSDSEVSFSSSSSSSSSSSEEDGITETSKRKGDKVPTAKERRENKRRRREDSARALPKGFLDPLPNCDSENYAEYSPKTKSQTEGQNTDSNTKANFQKRSEPKRYPLRKSESVSSPSPIKIKESRVMPNREIAPHHTLDTNFLKNENFPLCDWFEQQGWLKFLEAKNDIYLELTHTFYKNGKLIKDGEFLTFVTKIGEVDVVVTESMLNMIFGISPGGLEFTNSTPEENIMLQEIFQPDTDFALKKKGETFPPASKLKFEYKLAHFALVKCVRPLVSYNRVTKAHVFYLYHLGKMTKINFSRLIIQYMDETKEKKRGSLPYGSLITEICTHLRIPKFGSIVKHKEKVMIGKGALADMRIKKTGNVWKWNDTQVTHIRAPKVGEKSQSSEFTFHSPPKNRNEFLKESFKFLVNFAANTAKEVRDLKKSNKRLEKKMEVLSRGKSSGVEEEEEEHGSIEDEIERFRDFFEKYKGFIDEEE